MTRIEIKQFVLNTLGENKEYIVPFSVSVGAEEEYSFAAGLMADERILSSKYLYLRLSDVSGLVSVAVNGTVLLKRDFSGRILNVSVRDYLRVGENRIELCFKKSEPCRCASGLFGGAELLAFGSAAIDCVAVHQRLEGSVAELAISLDMLGNSENVRAVATLVSGSGQVFYGGLTRGRGVITVKDPLLWYPKGVGVQNLYKLTVNLYGEMEIEDTFEMRIGIRRIGASEGASLSASGIDFLPMGTVYLPEWRFDPVLSKNRETAILNSAARAGYNCLVIGLEERLPSDNFFELCDLHGIAVIREISPDSPFISDELSDLPRIANHASLSLYDVIGEGESVANLVDRIKRISPELAVVSSPMAQEYVSHPSLPSEKTLLANIPEGERNLFSEPMEALGREKILDMLTAASERFPYAKGLSDISYASNLASAEIVKSGICKARLERCRRAVFSSLGEREFGIFSSALDCSAIPKALEFYSARFFSGLLLSADVSAAGRVAFWIANDKRQDFVGEIEFKLCDNKNRVVFSGAQRASVKAGESKLESEIDLSEYILGNEKKYHLDYSLRDSFGVFSQGSSLFVPEKHYEYIDPEITAQIVGSERRFSITLSAGGFASGVEISFADRDAVFMDNYITITGSAPIKIPFSIIGGIETAEHLSRTLRIRSVYDLKKDIKS